MKPYTPIVLLAAVMLTGCWGGRYMSADPTLEQIYTGKSYYEIVADFGRPDATQRDGMEGTKLVYKVVSLTGSAAGSLYSQHNVRNRVTKETGAPDGAITFSLGANMRCYAVESDFQLERTKQPRPAKGYQGPVDPNRPKWVKPRLPRTVDFPYVESRSPYAQTVSIEKIELDQLKAKVYFMYKARTPKHQPINEAGLYLLPDVYIEDCYTGQRFKMVEADGITMYPERSQFAHNIGGYDVLVYSITFEPLPAEVEFINIIEPGHSGFNFYNVDTRKPDPYYDSQKGAKK